MRDHTPIEPDPRHSGRDTSPASTCARIVIKESVKVVRISEVDEFNGDRGSVADAQALGLADCSCNT
jgi:hypothetical protein